MIYNLDNQVPMQWFYGFNNTSPCQRESCYIALGSVYWVCSFASSEASKNYANLPICNAWLFYLNNLAANAVILWFQQYKSLSKRKLLHWEVYIVLFGSSCSSDWSPVCIYLSSSLLWSVPQFKRVNCFPICLCISGGATVSLFFCAAVELFRFEVAR